MAQRYNLVSGDAQRALEEFSTAFDQAFTAPDAETQWAQQFGLYNQSRAIRTTYPIPVSAAGYVERKGDDKMRSLYTRSMSLFPKQWVDGVAEDAMIIEAPDFIGWGDEPARIAVEARRQPNRLVAAMLEANPNLDFYRDDTLKTDLGIPLFSAASHPVNIFDTSLGAFGNITTGFSAINSDLFKSVMTKFRARKAANGKPLGLRVTDLIVPGALEQQARDFLESDLMRYAILAGGSNTQETSNNRFKNVVNLVVADELTDVDSIYFISSAGPKPWIVQHGGTPEEIRYDKTDAMYKDTNKVGVKYVLEINVGAALPHAIERADLA